MAIKNLEQELEQAIKRLLPQDNPETRKLVEARLEAINRESLLKRVKKKKGKTKS